MTLQSLYHRQPVLTREELNRHLDQGYSGRRRSREALIAYHLREGHLLRIRRGLYAVVPPGVPPRDCPVDPYLVASKSADDAVLAYHTALEVHGKAHSVFQRFVFLSRTPHRPWSFRGYRFQCSLFPKPLREAGRERFATQTVDRAGVDIAVTSLERTLVDLLDRPELGGGWEEIWRSLDSVEYVDVDWVARYAELLGNKTTAAKVGFYLEQNAKRLMIEPHHLEPLLKMRPRQPHYLQGGKKGTLINRWNLVVPSSLAQRPWEEIT